MLTLLLGDRKLLLEPIGPAEPIITRNRIIIICSIVGIVVITSEIYKRMKRRKELKEEQK